LGNGVFLIFAVSFCMANMNNVKICYNERIKFRNEVRKNEGGGANVPACSGKGFFLFHLQVENIP
jgi:hypothetical protein